MIALILSLVVAGFVGVTAWIEKRADETTDCLRGCRCGGETT